MSFPSFRSGIHCNLDIVSISLILFSFAFILVIIFFPNCILKKSRWGIA